MDWKDVFEEVAYLGADETTQRRIAETVARLPDEIRDYALSQCCFVSLDGTNVWACSLPGRYVAPVAYNSMQRGDWDLLKGFDVKRLWKRFIVLMETIPEDDVHFTIAHEIAHGWKEHDIIGDFEGNEKEADALANEWGFTSQRTKEL